MRTGLWCLGLLAQAALAATGNDVALTDVDRTRFPQVRVTLAVSAAGRPISGLTFKDLAITENGRAAGRFAMQPDTGPIRLALVVDLVRPWAPDAGALANAVSALVKRPGVSRAALVLPEWMRRPPVEGADAIAQTLRDPARYQGTWSLNPLADDPFDQASHAFGWNEVEDRDAVIGLLGAVEPGMNGQNSLKTRTGADVAASFVARGRPLFLVSIGTRAAAAELAKLCRSTGGRYLEAATVADLPKALDELMAFVAGRYRIAYRTPDPDADATFRELSITVRGDTARLRHVAPFPHGEERIADPSELTATTEGHGGAAVVLEGFDRTPAYTSVEVWPAYMPCKTGERARATATIAPRVELALPAGRWVVQLSTAKGKARGIWVELAQGQHKTITRGK